MCSAPLYANETTIDANMMDDGIENESLDEGAILDFICWLIMLLGARRVVQGVVVQVPACFCCW